MEKSNHFHGAWDGDFQGNSAIFISPNFAEFYWFLCDLRGVDWFPYANFLWYHEIASKFPEFNRFFTDIFLTDSVRHQKVVMSRCFLFFLRNFQRFLLLFFFSFRLRSARRTADGIHLCILAETWMGILSEGRRWGAPLPVPYMDRAWKPVSLGHAKNSFSVHVEIRFI